YNKYFIKEDGTVQPGHQASYVRVLAFDLADDKKTEKVAARLAEEVRKAGMKLNTGFLSTPFLLFQLVRYGYKKEAFTVLEQTEAPSWLHAVTLGATTILESWNGMDEHMASYNHYSYGAVCDFLFGKVGGIEPVMKYPGYKHFELSPMAGGSLTWAETRFDCPYGIIRSDWKLEDGLMKMHFEIPVNTTATVNLPDGRKFDLGSGSYDYSCTAPEV
ncbi:MAG: alpha-L-rhamnosidase, partial [Eubacterium sp.]|nr:alpha-L-rhamnosidase [Eubacterium sp.]